MNSKFVPKGTKIKKSDQNDPTKLDSARKQQQEFLNRKQIEQENNLQTKA